MCDSEDTEDVVGAASTEEHEYNMNKSNIPSKTILFINAKLLIQ